MADLDPERISSLIKHPAVAGSVGALMSLKWVPGKTFVDRAFNVAASASTTYYVAPPLCAWVHLTSTDQIAVISWACGVFGLGIAAGFMDAIRSGLIKTALQSWFVRKA